MWPGPEPVLNQHVLRRRESAGRRSESSSVLLKEGPQRLKYLRKDLGPQQHRASTGVWPDTPEDAAARVAPDGSPGPAREGAGSSVACKDRTRPTARSCESCSDLLPGALSGALRLGGLRAQRRSTTAASGAAAGASPTHSHYDYDPPRASCLPTPSERRYVVDRPLCSRWCSCGRSVSDALDLAAAVECCDEVLEQRPTVRRCGRVWRRSRKDECCDSVPKWSSSASPVCSALMPHPARMLGLGAYAMLGAWSERGGRCGRERDNVGRSATASASASASACSGDACTCEMHRVRARCTLPRLATPLKSETEMG